MPYTEASGTRICWDEHGSGDPLLLIMGATFSRRMWYSAIPSLAEHYRVITYDNRGFGESARTTAPYTVADMAADAEAVLDAAGVDTAHVYGVSMGGLTAQELALNRPERVRSLVLGCTWAAASDRRRSTWSSEIRFLIPSGVLLSLSKPILYGPRRDKARIAEDMKILRSDPMVRDELRAQARATFAYESRDRLGTLDVPALVLHGDHDRVIPYAWGEELARTLPTATFITLPGAGHSYLTDCPDEANEHVLRFLASQPRNATPDAPRPTLS